MTITLPDIQFLASETGQRLLERLGAEDLSEANTLHLLTLLRRDFSPEQARAGLEMARLRSKASEKFGDAAQRLFFTRQALEQASHPAVRTYRAARIAEQNHLLVDACCGIGADALAFAQADMKIIGLDIDPLRIELARYNAQALGLNARFEVADVREELPQAEVIFFDPGRRDDQDKRIFSVEAYQPPLSTVHHWQARQIVVKLSPGVDLAQLSAYPGEVEFISVEGDLKEAVLWLGRGRAGRRATLLTGGEVHAWNQANPATVPTVEPRSWLVEPDPALIRAGLVQGAASRFKGTLLDETIAYFTTDEHPRSVWVRAWQILDWMPFQLKRLRGYLRERNIGRVTVKKRGSAITPEELIPQLKLKGDNECVLVLTRYRGRPIVIVCSPYAPTNL